MGIIKTIKATKYIFPEVMTNEFVNSLPRRELTDKEKNLPYAKYYYKDMALIPQEDLDAVNRGPIDPKDAMPIEENSRILDPGYQKVETGFSVLPNGCGYAATKVFMPGVTPTMLDWWFNWHPLENLRYAIWCPVAHAGISAETPEAHKDSSGVDLSVRNNGKSHFPLEGFILDGAAKLRIWFRSPEQIGLDMKRFKEPYISSCYTATVTSEIGPIVIPINIFIHAVRQVEGGVEYRSRYWLGRTIDWKGRIVKPISPLSKDLIYSMARCNCIHSLIEYNHLASILPALYEEHQGKIL